MNLTRFYSGVSERSTISRWRENPNVPASQRDSLLGSSRLEG
jgi:hypothetical protein